MPESKRNEYNNLKKRTDAAQKRLTEKRKNAVFFKQCLPNDCKTDDFMLVSSLFIEFKKTQREEEAFYNKHKVRSIKQECIKYGVRGK